MKIAISTSVVQRGKTGVAQYVFALIRSLLKNPSGNEYVLYVLQEDLPLFAFAEGKMKLVTVEEKWRSAMKNILWHQFILPGMLKKEGVDVLHIPSYRRMIGSYPCALVSTIHDLAPFRVRGKYDIARMLYGRVVVKWLARLQHQILAVSQCTANDINAFFGPLRTKPRVVLNGLDHARFHPGDLTTANEAVKEQWQLDKPYFLFVSRLEHPAKNHVRLIEAFNRFKAETNSPWVLALGGADWHGAEVIHAAAQASPYRSDIRFLGFVPDESLPDLYRAAGAMVYPSLFEGFGLPPVEAMACACPVISSTKGALSEIVGHAAVTVDPECVESMSGALAQVSLDGELRTSLIKAGLTNARRFDWDANAADTLRMYRQAWHNFAGNAIPSPVLSEDAALDTI